MLELKTFSGATFVGTNIQIKFNEFLLTKCVYCNDELFSTIQNISEVRILFLVKIKGPGIPPRAFFICTDYKQYYNHICRSTLRGSAPKYFYFLCKPIQEWCILCPASGMQYCFIVTIQTMLSTVRSQILNFFRPVFAPAPLYTPRT